jgi:hypothetical protein
LKRRKTLQNDIEEEKNVEATNVGGNVAKKEIIDIVKDGQKDEKDGGESDGDRPGPDGIHKGNGIIESQRALPRAQIKVQKTVPLEEEKTDDERGKLTKAALANERKRKRKLNAEKLAEDQQQRLEEEQQRIEEEQQRIEEERQRADAEKKRIEEEQLRIEEEEKHEFAKDFMGRRTGGKKWVRMHAKDFMTERTGGLDQRSLVSFLAKGIEDMTLEENGDEKN